MEPKLVRTDVAEYVPARYEGVNRSGIRPIGELVLVLTDQVAEQTAGGIFITAGQRERNELAAETGVIVAVGDGAFKWTADKTRSWEGYAPKPGDRVYIRRYSGTLFPGDDGQKYRIVEYTEIGAVRDEPIKSAE